MITILVVDDLKNVQLTKRPYCVGPREEEEVVFKNAGDHHIMAHGHVSFVNDTKRTYDVAIDSREEE